MDTIEAIHTRRSTRKFKDGVIPEKDIDRILSAAMHAPSAGNQQPWHFMVLKDKKIVNDVIEHHPNATMAKDASLSILVCGDRSLEVYKGFWVQDCSAAVQNILLAAHSLGYGAVWTGIHPVEERTKKISSVLELPENVIPLALIPLGIPDNDRKNIDRFDKERIHINSW